MLSPAYDLAKAEASDAEIRAALLPDVRAALPLAIRAVRQELAPGGPQDQEEMAVCLGRQIGLLKAGLRVEDKEDWIAVALGEIKDLPPDMVLEALREVRRKARFEGDVIPLVLDLVEPQVARLQTEKRIIEKLEAIAE